MITEGTIIAKGRHGEVIAPTDFCRATGNINFEVWLGRSEYIPTQNHKLLRGCG